MKHRLSTTLAGALAVTLALAAPARAVAQQAAKGEPAANGPVSNTTKTERTVQIVWDADATPPDIGGVLSRLFGEQGAIDIAKRVLNVQNADAAKKMVERVGRLEVTERGCKFSFRVSLGDVAGARPAANEMADALVDRLSSLLRNDRQEMAAVQANRVRNELDELRAKLERTKNESRDKHAKLLATAGRADLSAATLQASVSKLEDERQRAELDLAGMEARLEAVQEQIKASGDRAKEQIAGDPVIAELEKAVAARQKLVAIARERTDQGLQSPAEAAKAETDLIEARVQLLDRRESASARGGDALAPLAREMQNLGIEIRDRKARLALATKKLEPLRAVAEEFQDLEWMQEETASLRRACEEALERFRDAQRRADDAPVDRVFVVSAPGRVEGQGTPENEPVSR